MKGIINMINDIAGVYREVKNASEAAERIVYLYDESENKRDFVIALALFAADERNFTRLAAKSFGQHREK